MDLYGYMQNVVQEKHIGHESFETKKERYTYSRVNEQGYPILINMVVSKEWYKPLNGANEQDRPFRKIITVYPSWYNI